ncbi:glycerophosphocholine cholinephosphodiesterase ENPP6-like [Argiope bruennichi]|uniref:glycerophosphocholine cholinephosphodiesterase ENPP6-like n=1 Tax=Argiope bruennichi TaxID=94029 RepID=UPI002495893B|nr:glycerophosphocholine cholinephosphodiesterase ENPP6-like [Argiope bruennichi]
MKFKVSVVLVAFVFLIHCLSEVTASNKLIVVLVDGVRWDYLNDKNLKGFRRIMENGVRAPYVNPVFPSLSYPNWETLVTGLYPENHGFVGNHIYDNASDSVFAMLPKPGADDARWWNDAEPIWITAEKNSKRSAMYWWAGCEVEIRGSHPTICERWSTNYEGLPSKETRTDFLERIDDVVQLFKPSKKFSADRLSLVLMYYDSVDYAGHMHGPKSAEVTEALQDIDEILNKMQQKIKDAHLEDEVNIMVLSDHGMTDARENVLRYIDLTKYADKIKHQLDFGAVSGIVPQPGMLNKLVQEIANDKTEGLRIYKKDDIPENYHLKGSYKTAPILLIANKGYYIQSLSKVKMQGHHGYDPVEVPDMRTIFLASGPDFRKGHTTAPLSTLDMYNVMCHVLDIPPLPNNGSLERVQSMFTRKKNLSPNSISITSAASSAKSSSCFIHSMIIIYSSLFTMMFLKFL